MWSLTFFVLGKRLPNKVRVKLFVCLSVFFLISCLAQRLDKALREKHSGDKKRHEQLQNSLSQSLTNSLSGKLEKAVKAEVKSVVLPAVQKALSTVQEQLNTTLTQVTDNRLHL